MQSRCAFGTERCLQRVKGVLRSSCIRRYPPKYPMIHDKGFLVLLLFSGLPEGSACLSASEERKKHGTTSEMASFSFTTRHRNKRCRWETNAGHPPHPHYFLWAGENCSESRLPRLTAGLTHQSRVLTCKVMEQASFLV